MSRPQPTLGLPGNDTECRRTAGRFRGMVEPHIRRHLARRQADLRRWLAEHAPQVEHEQHHLRDGTAERAYWHYGYYSALRDIEALLGPES